MIRFRLGRPGINLFNPEKILLFLWFFLLVFPKGGFKISGVPMTWGYLLLGIVSFFIHLTRTNYTLHSSRYLPYLFLIPFQIVSLSHLILNHVPLSGMTLSFLINFFFLPYVFFLSFSQNIESLDLDKFFALLKKGIYYISIYGIFLFAFKQITGKFLEIPFLTTNWSDLGELENKCNNRGFIFKLISTYNNGNLYGICLLIFLPLYCYLENSSWRRAVVKTSLFLTFSRTVWIGLFFHEFCYCCFVEKKKIIKLPILALTTFVFISLSFYYDYLFFFIFDSNLGGRRDQLDALQNLTFFSSNSFDSIGEIVYLGILNSFGISGLFTFLLGMSSPLLLRLSRGGLSKSQISMCLGIVNYLFISCSDGAILYIPVMAFFWFLCSLLMRKDISLKKPAFL